MTDLTPPKMKFTITNEQQQGERKNENDTGFWLQKRQMPNNEKRLHIRFGRVVSSVCCSHSFSLKQIAMA